ncbi:TPA: hypothetical protein N0F65_008461 [Lagenidium giganteum]|uniref:Uncharacterized protein n=1 Tax=Lagenidium giganteum TaxID=4803 RepID=A0AAV2YI01_9STRA|nr:TPA: hypothetical protein N0F65_008461 [Lagenidium giganteum]
MRTYPWFVRTHTCAVVELNCHRLNTTGRATELDQVLQAIEPAFLVYLAFTHCPALEASVGLQRFPSLKILEINNTTIVDWSMKAALVRHKHPQLSLLYLTHVNMSTLPDGLQHPDFHPSNLQQVPDALTHYLVDMLSFVSNNVSMLPADMVAKQQLYTFSVGDNPYIHRGSDVLDTGAAGLYQHLHHQSRATGRTSVVAQHQHGETPFCGNHTMDVRKVHCALLDRQTLSIFPVEVKDRLRQP